MTMGNPSQIQVRALRENLADFLRQAQQGAEFVVVTRGRPVALISPPPAQTQRRFGVMKGRIWMAPDFDETPQDMIDAMEADLEP